MFRIESYVTPILLSYVDKYVQDFKPEDAQVSLWGGGVALHNLVLKPDMLQREVALPFTLVSGRIHELLIQVPWTKIMSEPIVVTIDTIECVLSLNQPRTASNTEGSQAEEQARRPQMETPPGYMQALVKRIVSNIALNVHHLIVKYVQDDMVLSLNVKHLAVDSADSNWAAAFADIDQGHPVIRRLVRLDDLTLCLDSADADGKIRFFQEPLLYRCTLDLRVLTRLMSANTRRASNISIQARSTKLVWSVTSDQLAMLLRLYQEKEFFRPATPQRKPSTSITSQTINSSSNTGEPARTGSWTDWAWSWLPQWSDRETDDHPVLPRPLPIHVSAYLDEISISFKNITTESLTRKRWSTVLELHATHFALKHYICKPISQKIRFGIRQLTVFSKGRCVCGQMDYRPSVDDPIVFLKRREACGEWQWPDLLEDAPETRVADDSAQQDKEQAGAESSKKSNQPDHGHPEEPQPEIKAIDEREFWANMAPMVYVDFSHERTPTVPGCNPFDNPPIDFEYSDWLEEVKIKIKVEPVAVMLCMGLFHRLYAIRNIYRDMAVTHAAPEPLMRVLTMEENEALLDNIPERRIEVEAGSVKVCVAPWDHTGDRARPSALLLHVEVARTGLVLIRPLYPHRVCSAACQVPEDSGPLWRAARLDITLTVHSMQATLASPSGEHAKLCARMDVRAVLHILLNKSYFTERESIFYALSLKICEANICGSTARLEAAYEVLRSLLIQRVSLLLRHTSLATDAFTDDDAVAIDLSAEDFILRAFMTRNTNTIIATLQSMKATAFHEPEGEPLKQAWFFSGPDAPVSTPYLRLAVQWVQQQHPSSLDYIGIWTEPTGICVDPLLIAWLAYKPVILQSFATDSYGGSLTSLRRRFASSTRAGHRRVTDLTVHRRPASNSSSNKTAETKPEKTEAAPWWRGDRLLQLHQRLCHMLINIELGLSLLYVTMTSASALDCATMRDAMERHASLLQQVLAISLGRISMYSCSLTKHFWQDIKHDGPTFLHLDPNKVLAESFPWRLRLADVSCYTLSFREITVPKYDVKGKAKRSQLKSTLMAKPRNVLELVTTTVTLSVVTKTLQIVTMPKTEPPAKKPPVDQKEQRTKYFTSGMSFKPTSLKEFVRGPAKRQKPTVEEPKKEPDPGLKAPKTSSGPVVSLGVHLHADTPPLIVRLEQDQVHLVAATVHCFQHIVALVKRPSLHPGVQKMSSSTSLSRSTIRSVSEEVPVGEMGSRSSGDLGSNESEQSDLVPLFVANPNSQLRADKHGLKTFFYFQWVISRITVVGTEQNLKLAFDIDDVIATSDIQAHYNQLKIKIASVSIRHFEKTTSFDWTAGAFNGRVLEARDAMDSKGEDNFLSITITQARISKLPPNWKKELHPKLLEQKSGNDCMWEVFATLAPLEIVIEPKVLKEIVSLLREMQPRSYCPLDRDTEQAQLQPWEWPFFYVTAGGLRLLLKQDRETKDLDDTIVFSVGCVTVTPHPDNPIIRRSTLSVAEAAWGTPEAGTEGLQYEMQVKNICIYTAPFQDLVSQEATFVGEYKSNRNRENPALKWGKPIPLVEISPILHTLDISSVLAPGLYVADTMTCGPALELNLVSDCYIELNLEQVVLLKQILTDIYVAFEDSADEYSIIHVGTHAAVCPYAALIEKQESILTPSQYFHEAADSGYGVDSVEDVTKAEQFQDPPLLKKTTSSRVAFVEKSSVLSDYLEVYVTMGLIKVCLNMKDDASPEAVALRPPALWDRVRHSRLPDPIKRTDITKRKSTVSENSGKSSDSSKAASEDEAYIPTLGTYMRSAEKNIPLIHVILWQPNVYYWRRKVQKTLQFSIFNAWIGMGSGDSAKWTAPIFMTARGTCDPMTDIPPALATIKMVAPCTGFAMIGPTTRGSINIDVERPIQVEVCVDTLQRLKIIYDLMKSKNLLPAKPPDPAFVIETLHPLYVLRKFLMEESIENVTMTTSQITFVGTEGAIGWDSSSLQIGVGSRPLRLLCARALLTAAVVSAGPAGDSRHVLLHPLMLGIELESTWELWRHVEGRLAYHVPFTHVCLDIDRVIVDLRPADLAAVRRLISAWQKLMTPKVSKAPSESSSDEKEKSEEEKPEPGPSRRNSDSSHYDTMPDDHYYSDDLRSGVFKIVSGGQLPMAYQVTLHDNAVAWRYPYPRAITRLVAFPLPGQVEETPCVLELYNFTLNLWEQHSHFTIPVGEPLETQLHIAPPDAVFARMWRYRVYEAEERYPPFIFDHTKFLPKADPLTRDSAGELPAPRSSRGVTSEQLASAVRVDSCFSPRIAPHFKVVTRLSLFLLHFHNDLPRVASQNTSLEGYYVSKPLMRSHRVLTLRVSDASAHFNFASPAGALLILHTYFSSDLLDCSTGTMEPMVYPFRVQTTVSFPDGRATRARAALARVHAALNVSMLRTLHALAIDWMTAYQQYIRRLSRDINAAARWLSEAENARARMRKEPAEAAALEGRVALWIHNTTSSALRVGQEGTDEVVPLGPGKSLAYRWHSPTAAKKLRFSVAGPTADWHWSASIPFTPGSYRIRLNESEPAAGGWQPGCGVFLHSSVEELGARRSLTLAGRLCAANMLRQNLLYKVRAANQDRQWLTISSGELLAERISNSIICTTDSELVLKIKFTDQEMGWSGDIPLKQCPKENVPWLVKVPSSSEPPYTCVWCRVVRARSDSRLVVSVWPLYVLYSHLPLDTDVLIKSHQQTKAEESGASGAEPLVMRQTPGRGASMHLLAPGTTAARHSLSFQYTGLNCPVTGESIPLHYGVTDASVFDKRAPVGSIEEVIAEINQWLERSGPSAVSSWPYSTVVNHWPGQWRPSKLQPRSDVTIRYQAVNAGGGCSLELQLCPVVMLCNATPIALTLRSHDAAPLCKLDPGTAITPSSVVLKKPFFLSVEMGRETYVSGQLAVTGVDLGRYGTPGRGLLAVDHPAEVAVLCDHKVALLTMFYEIKEDINVLGITSTYVLMNKMKFKILVSAMAVPKDTHDDIELHPSRFKVIDPTPKDSVHGTPLCRFFLVGRWRGGGPQELRLYLSVSVNGAQRKTAPVHVGHPPLRRALCLFNEDNQSIPVVLTQVKTEGRWVLTLSEDPCPEFVICNMTMHTFYAAQPTDSRDEPSTSKIKVRPECSGVDWHCTLSPLSLTHYSTPSHCARFPPPATPAPPALTFLVLSMFKVEWRPAWCTPIAATDGEQLVQVAEGVTVKVHVRLHPHSSLVQIKDVDQHDISASEIRNRLFGMFSEDDLISNRSGFPLRRTDADDKLLPATPAMVENKDPVAVSDYIPSNDHRISFDKNTPTALKAPVETATSSESKSPVETASHTDSKSPVETFSHTDSKSPVETFSHTDSKSPVETASHTDSKSPVETASHTDSKSPVETASHTDSNSPVETDSHKDSKAETKRNETSYYTDSKVPNDTTNYTGSKGSDDTTSHTDSKAADDTISHTDSKVPDETTSHTDSKVPDETTSHTDSKAAVEPSTPTACKTPEDTDSHTDSKAPDETAYYTESKVPNDTTTHTDSKAAVKTASHTDSKTLEDTDSRTDSKAPDDIATPSASNAPYGTVTSTDSEAPVDNATEESNASAVKPPGVFWSRSPFGLGSFFGARTPIFGSYEPVPYTPPVSAEPSINTTGPSEANTTVTANVPSEPNDQIVTANLTGSYHSFTNVAGRADNPGTPAIVTFLPQVLVKTVENLRTRAVVVKDVPSGPNAPDGTDVSSRPPEAPVEQVPMPFKMTTVDSQELSSTHTPLGPRSSDPETADAGTSVPSASELTHSLPDPSTLVLLSEPSKSECDDIASRRIFHSFDSASTTFSNSEWNEAPTWPTCDRLRVVASGFSIELAAINDERPLVALHLDRAALLVKTDSKRIKTCISIANVQIDNLQYESGQFDFAVIASTRAEATAPPKWLPLWNSFGLQDYFATQHETARALLNLTHDKWTVQSNTYREVTEVEVRLGPLALYVEDAYVSALAGLARAASPASAHHQSAEEAALRSPLRLRLLLIHPLDLTLTLHTAVRMYIALDHSPLTLGAFRLTDMVTSTERLTHALTVHYLSAAILGAGWVVGGLELLGAPGALAARVGGARGGVRGVASAAAAALLRSLSAWAGSLARNLDLLAGDEDHIRRAAANRRRPPASLIAGLVTGITNFAINILGAVGGLAHHPLVSVAVGEAESSATALRRGLVGAFAKPLSATADLVAFAGHGLLAQTGWDPVPQARAMWVSEYRERSGWQRDCVRWVFRLASLDSINGFRVLLDSAPLQLIFTHKFLVVADPESERIVEMIDLKFCTIHPFEGGSLELSVTQKRQSKLDTRGDEDDEYEVSAAAMARVARYTGAGLAEGAGEARLLTLIPTPGTAPSLHCLLQALIHQNHATHFSML